MLADDCLHSAVGKVASSTLELTFGLLALGAALANFVTRVALANHIDSAASAHDLAVWVTELQGTDGGYHFHDGCFSYRMVGKLNCNRERTAELQRIFVPGIGGLLRRRQTLPRRNPGF
jgi:hypothetical protein